jgi:sugar phosphate permease
VPTEAAGASTGIYRTAQYIGASLAAVVAAHVIGADHALGGIREMGIVIAGIGLALLVLSLAALATHRRKGEEQT